MAGARRDDKADDENHEAKNEKLNCLLDREQLRECVLKWCLQRHDTQMRPLEAKAFYAAIVTATLARIGINLSPIDPIRALFWSAVINGCH